MHNRRVLLPGNRAPGFVLHAGPALFGRIGPGNQDMSAAKLCILLKNTFVEAVPDPKHPKNAPIRPSAPAPCERGFG